VLQCVAVCCSVLQSAPEKMRLEMVVEVETETLDVKDEVYFQMIRAKRVL